MKEMVKVDHKGTEKIKTEIEGIETIETEVITGREGLGEVIEMTEKIQEDSIEEIDDTMMGKYMIIKSILKFINFLFT